MKRVELAGLAVEASSGTPVVMLREQEEPHRILPIFVGGPEATAIALAAAGETAPRPLTIDLMAALVEQLGGTIDTIEVSDMDEGTFVATLTLLGPDGEHRVDARPSDAIALAVRTGAPVFVSEAVLEASGAQPEPPEADEPAIDPAAIDPAAIDAAVDEFRSFLDDVDPAQFAEGA